MIVTVINPDAPFDSPAFDGEPADAHKRLDPGAYRCEWTDANDNMQWGTLVVTDGKSLLVMGDASKAVRDLKVGDKISFAIGDRPWNEFSGPRDIAFTTGTIEHNDPLNSHGGRNLGIRDRNNTLHIRSWHEDEMVDMAALWNDAYGNEYALAPAAKDVTVGAELMLAPGTYYTVEDSSGYAEGEMYPRGTIAVATNIDGDGAVYGKVAGVELVNDRMLITLADDPCPAWTLSVPATQFVYVA